MSETTALTLVRRAGIGAGSATAGTGHGRQHGGQLGRRGGALPRLGPRRAIPIPLPPTGASRCCPGTNRLRMPKLSGLIAATLGRAVLLGDAPLELTRWQRVEVGDGLLERRGLLFRGRIWSLIGSLSKDVVARATPLGGPPPQGCCRARWRRLAGEAAPTDVQRQPPTRVGRGLLWCGLIRRSACR